MEDLESQLVSTFNTASKKLTLEIETLVENTITHFYFIEENKDYVIIVSKCSDGQTNAQALALTKSQAGLDARVVTYSYIEGQIEKCLLVDNYGEFKDKALKLLDPEDVVKYIFGIVFPDSLH